MSDTEMYKVLRLARPSDGAYQDPGWGNDVSIKSYGAIVAHGSIMTNGYYSCAGKTGIRFVPGVKTVYFDNAQYASLFSSTEVASLLGTVSGWTSNNSNTSVLVCNSAWESNQWQITGALYNSENKLWWVGVNGSRTGYCRITYVIFAWS